MKKFLVAFSVLFASSVFAHGVGDAQSQFFDNLASQCGARYEGHSTYPTDPDHDFAGKLLVATIASCDEKQIRIPFWVGEDKSRTWILNKTHDGLEFKHDHRHKDGTPDEQTNYGGTTAQSGSAHQQAFPADAFTAELIPAAATNVWTVTLNKEDKSLTYSLTRHGKPRYEAKLFLVSE